ncbi:hypothetical protein Nepgr_032677 [Nepenthes gracilis]|uniref:Uncharacterized protein n=1 Tax=Nepenthes gracilis TaxID=150966 RepID=A0AAD3TKF1_NEPGR|nr:hypothetical protein Nepgr_032677 [Nepenthes gracilis]
MKIAKVSNCGHCLMEKLRRMPTFCKKVEYFGFGAFGYPYKHYLLKGEPKCGAIATVDVPREEFHNVMRDGDEDHVLELMKLCKTFSFPFFSLCVLRLPPTSLFSDPSSCSKSGSGGYKLDLLRWECRFSSGSAGVYVVWMSCSSFGCPQLGILCDFQIQFN